MNQDSRWLGTRDGPVEDECACGGQAGRQGAQDDRVVAEG
jgi:hypothetical protein